jgi:nucleoid-associated protein YgaU
MRLALLLLALASAFGLAALWQSRHQAELRRRREVAAQVAHGHASETPAGLVPAGVARLTLGAPSGAAPLERPSPALVADAGEFEPPPLPDFTLTVQAGQTLSEISRQHYGSSDAALVLALAAYNGLDHPDQLAAGDRLLLPELQKLARPSSSSIETPGPRSR